MPDREVRMVVYCRNVCGWRRGRICISTLTLKFLAMQGILSTDPTLTKVAYLLSTGNLFDGFLKPGTVQYLRLEICEQQQQQQLPLLQPLINKYRNPTAAQKKQKQKLLLGDRYLHSFRPQYITCQDSNVETECWHQRA